MNTILKGDGRERFTAQFSFMPLLEEFELEMETIEEKQTQLDAIIAEFKKYRIALNISEMMLPRALLPRECTEARTWVGPAFYQGTPVEGRRQHMLAGHINVNRPQTHSYVVRSVIWHMQEEKISAESRGSGTNSPL